MNDILGYTTPVELEVISSWAKHVPKNSTVVELGSFFGRSSIAWVENAHPSIKIYCIDWFLENLYIDWNDGTQPSYPAKGVTYNVWESFLDNTKNYSNIIPLRGNSPKDITYPGDLIDVLFIDLHHQNPVDIDNLNFFIPFMKPNGVICGHDYCDAWPDVKDNVKFLEEKFNKTATFYEGTTLWKIDL